MVAEEYFTNSLSLNHRVIGGLRFCKRLEIRDAITYLRYFVTQPADGLAFERIIDTINRDFGNDYPVDPKYSSKK
ncbi:MAG: helicase [Candidatus Tokpelaia sp. JSC188]|nr:MAG: helicase [Candidatus Tokpelaia sp. JSC188]